jgi:ABC-type protease/lipase transport system fused ATPase/permease subunit
VQIKGPSGSGKTSLARVLVGAWKPHSGTVRLDGSDIHQWNRIELGPAIGYLPQSVDLMEGTLLENITRFADPDERALQEAIEATGLHEILDRLPQGLQTRIQPLSGMLSGGERQRVALARAIYGWPVLLVLDEPDANLDPQGKLHLLRVIEDMKRRGAIVLVITYTANDYPVDSVMDVVS